MHRYSIHEAFYSLKEALSSLYDPGEAVAVAHAVLEQVTGLSRLQRLGDKSTMFTSQQQLQFDEMKERLLNGEPLQYVTGIQWFLGRQFSVNKSVLIPRPETEELVAWITIDWKRRQTVRILDVGTGSGCIPISLKLQMPQTIVTSCDISADALVTARGNASALNADITLLELDFLQQENWPQLDSYDVIVSNPPYIPEAEKESLEKNVRDFEPATALFIPNNDALIFYKALAVFGKTHLANGGAIYCELHKDYAGDCADMFRARQYLVELRNDMHGNARMLKAVPN